MKKRGLTERDQDSIWHPYSQHGLGHAILPVRSGDGAWLEMEEGGKTTRVLDGISSWWVNLHGHSHPRLAEAISQQAKKLEHVLFAGFTHEPAVELAERILSHPATQRARLKKVFYSDNGSTAIEVALKMAYQFHFNQGETKRVRFLALHHSYHGDTLGAMAVGEPNGMHQIFRRLLPQVDFVEPGDLGDLKSKLEQNGSEYAAWIFEPLVQGAAGMRMHQPEYLKAAVKLCQDHGVLTIADEVFTGFYRTGKCFAFEHAEIRPDFVCLSKGITGGFLPLAVTLTTEDVFHAFYSQEIREAFLHGHSYTANPIACAVAIASWDLLHEKSVQERIRRIGEITSQEIEKLRNHPKIRTARSLGTIGAIELDDDSNYFTSSPRSLYQKAIQNGVLLRPLGNVLYAVPPYCCTDDEIREIYRVMGKISAEHGQSPGDESKNDQIMPSA